MSKNNDRSQCRHVKKFAGPYGDLVNAHCLYRFDEPVSPHLAVNMAAERRGAGVGTYAYILSCIELILPSLRQDVTIPTDDAFTTSVASHIRKCASGLTERAHMYVETAGGET